MSVNAVANAAVVDAATHILEFTTRYVLLEMSPAEAKTHQCNGADQNGRDGSNKNRTGVREHRAEVGCCVCD